MNIISPDLLCFTSDEELAQQVEALNLHYRAGKPLVTDAHFDALFNELEKRNPNHAIVKNVQPELLDAKGRIAHPKAMLSTEKCYTLADIKDWLEKVAAYVGETVATGQTLIRVSIKMDGCAGRYAPDSQFKLVTRGDGQFGNDFSHLLRGGLVFKGEAANSVGEVICDEDFFQQHLKPAGVAHPRNFVAGLISADVLNPLAEKALKDGAIHFVTYKDLESNVVLKLCDVLANIEKIEADLIANSPYRTDGIILQVHSDALFESMGHSSRSHYGQIAKKIAGEPVEATMTGVTYQIGRSGRATPVISISETEMSGAMVTSVTAHHAGNVQRLGLGAGAVGLFLRSGEVIPYLFKCLKKSDEVIIPKNCPCCQSVFAWEGDFLVCKNDACKGRIASQLEFLTKTLDMDLIGAKAAEKLAEAGIDCIGLLSISADRLEAIGFGAGQSSNIIKELSRIQSAPVDDFKILASLGIHTLGKRASKNLLSEHPIHTLGSLTVDDICAIAGFADTKAQAIVEGLVKNAELLAFLLGFFQTVQASKIEVAKDAPLVGKSVVFTGTLSSGSRTDVERQAELLGAKVQKAVNKLTHYLVCGSGVGASKINKAAELGVQVISEGDYLAMIA